MSEVNRLSATNGAISLNGAQRMREQSVQFWLFFIDKKKRLTTRFLNVPKDVPEEEIWSVTHDRIMFSPARTEHDDGLQGLI